MVIVDENDDYVLSLGDIREQFGYWVQSHEILSGNGVLAETQWGIMLQHLRQG
jgi:hypothetical protein